MRPASAATAGTLPAVPWTATTPLVVIANGRSGSCQPDRVRDALQRSGRDHALILVGANDEPGAVVRAAVARAAERGAAVIAAGGDGTVALVAGAVLSAALPFGLLPLGTFNYFGRAHRVPEDVDAAVDALASARVRSVQVGLINQRVFIVNASIGLYPRALRQREAATAQLGRHRVVAVAAGLYSVLARPRRTLLALHTAEGSRTVRTNTLFVGNNSLQLERLGIAEAQAPHEGELAAILISAARRREMLALLLRGAVGALGDAGTVESFAFSRMTVDLAGRRRTTPIRVACDGEVVQMQLPLQFEVAPQPLYLLAPAPSA